jgi:hypothetical protein
MITWKYILEKHIENKDLKSLAKLNFHQSDLNCIMECLIKFYPQHVEKFQTFLLLK